MAKKPRIKNKTYSLGLIVAASLSFTTISHAESFLCDGTQAAANQLPQLSQSCPIGKGLWGKALPNKNIEDPTFWIQCGMLAKTLPLATAKPLYQKISTDVWMKPEGNGYRCLIGPYDNFPDAKKELSQVRSLKAYKEAFIRVVDKSAPQAQQPVKSAPTANNKALKAKGVKTKEPKAKEPKAKMSPSVRNTMKPKSTQVLATSELTTNTDISVRVQTQVDGRTYVVPYVLDDNNQFYMEHSKAWNRLSYDNAGEVCSELKMRLVTEGEWKKLLATNVMEKDSWPMHLPYWGHQKKGLFTNGRVTQLKGSSLLNVLCVK